MQIFAGFLDGNKLTLDVEPNSTIEDVKKQIQRIKGIHPENQQIIFAGKQTRDEGTLSHYRICRESTLHVILKRRNTAQPPAVAVFPTDNGAKKTSREWKTVADRGDFDEDLHIVDPQVHFHLLKQLEREVVERSEFFEKKGQYSFDQGLDPDSIQNSRANVANVPAWLRSKIENNMQIWKAVDKVEVDGLLQISHLWRSYIIICGAVRSLEQMTARGFCIGSFSILLKHQDKDIVEIKRIRSDLIENIKTGAETAIGQILEDLDDNAFLVSLRECLYLPCLRFLDTVGFSEPSTAPQNVKAMMMLFRNSALLIDNAIVSYVGSHGSRFDHEFLERDCSIIVGESEDSTLGFRCSLRSLTCLDVFIDKKNVWVFQMYGSHRGYHNLYGVDSTNITRPLSVLTRMEDLADIWGPVWTMRTATGLIKHYCVSKGSICRVKSRTPCEIPNAVECHYYSRASFYRRQASNLLSRSEELLLAEDNLLLIAGGLQVNRYCEYKISDFAADFEHEMTILGTKSSTWKTETRTLSLGVSKIFGATVSGSQKLIPETTLKQHILEKWTNNPSRANPGVLNQYLGVEISHCTGNARRISLKDLLLTGAVWPILERQAPGWARTPWGWHLKNALQKDDTEAIFTVWKDYAKDRTNMAELFCCVFELLDSTGRDNSGEFRAAYLENNEDCAISISSRINDWSMALRDSHLMAAYVFMNEVCLCCNVPNHTTSTCQGSGSFTVLQTQIAIDGGRPLLGRGVKLVPHGDHLTEVAGGSGETFLLMKERFSNMGVLSVQNLARRRKAGIEMRNQTANSSNMVYLRASSEGYHGMSRARQRLTSSLHEHADIDHVVSAVATDAHPSSPQMNSLTEQQSVSVNTLVQGRSTIYRPSQGTRSVVHQPNQRYAPNNNAIGTSSHRQGQLREQAFEVQSPEFSVRESLRETRSLSSRTLQSQPRTSRTTPQRLNYIEGHQNCIVPESRSPHDENVSSNQAPTWSFANIRYDSDTIVNDISSYAIGDTGHENLAKIEERSDMAPAHQTVNHTLKRQPRFQRWSLSLFKPKKTASEREGKM